MPFMVFSFIFIILGWFWNFLIISVTESLLTGSGDKNYYLNLDFPQDSQSMTLMFQNSLSSETTLSSSIRVVVLLSPTLLERKGFAVFQNCLLSVIFLTLGCQSHFPFLFEILQHSDLFVCCKPVHIPKILYSGNLLRNLEWVIITFRTSFVIKED